MTSEEMDSKYSDNDVHNDKSQSFLEAAHTMEAQPRTIPDEHTVPLQSKLLFLGAWFSLNLILTISNKAVLATVSVASTCK